MSNAQKLSKSKSFYQVTNWSSYNKSLICRGDITIWFDCDILSTWFFDSPKQQGGQFVYSDSCMECLLGIKSVFKLGYRQLEGFSKSIVKLMGLSTTMIPSYSQICRRATDLTVNICVPTNSSPMHIVLDSTGLKVYGEGEWKTRKHGISKRRTWRKLHLAIDANTGFIHANKLTKNGEGDGDAQQLEDLVKQVESPIEKLSGDGAYDTHAVWKFLKQEGIQGVIPPQKNAVYWRDENGNILDLDRNKILKLIETDGRKQWKKESGYHKRSLAETGMSRFKKTFTPNLYSKNLKKQKTEINIKVKYLNKMTELGMPISKKRIA